MVSVARVVSPDVDSTVSQSGGGFDQRRPTQQHHATQQPVSIIHYDYYVTSPMLFKWYMSVTYSFNL